MARIIRLVILILTPLSIFAQNKDLLYRFGATSGVVNENALKPVWGNIQNTPFDFSANRIFYGNGTGQTSSANLQFSNNNLLLNGNLYGGLGAKGTGGVANWNDVTNSTSGSGETLLYGTATNGNGVSAYYHPLNFEYVSKDGTGAVTQIGVPYYPFDNVAEFAFRGRYLGSWSNWRRLISTDNQKRIRLGGTGETILYPETASYTAPAQGTRMAFMNVSQYSSTRVFLTSSENGYHVNIELLITRFWNQNANEKAIIYKTGVNTHPHSWDIAFSADDQGNIFFEKVLYSTARTIRVTRIEQFFGTASLLTGSLTNTGVGSADETILSSNYWKKTGTNIYLDAASLNYNNVGFGTTNPQNRLHVSATTNPLRLDGLQTGTSNSVLVQSGGVVQVRDASTLQIDYSNVQNKPSFDFTANRIVYGNGTGQTSSSGLTFGNGVFNAQAVFKGGFGSASTAGIADWNDASNSTAGSSETLLLGNATNGFGYGAYFHPFSFEYSSKNGSGNATQLAIPYLANDDNGQSIYFRSRYAGAWNGWQRIIKENSAGNVGIGLTAAYKLDVSATANPLRLTGLQSNNSAASILVQTGGVVQTRDVSTLPVPTLNNVLAANNTTAIDINSTGSVSTVNLTATSAVNVGNTNFTLQQVSSEARIQSWAGLSQTWRLGANEEMRLNGTGLGIKTTSPQYPLDVLGDCRLTGSLRIGPGSTHSTITRTAGSSVYNTTIGGTHIFQSGGVELAQFDGFGLKLNQTNYLSFRNDASSAISAMTNGDVSYQPSNGSIFTKQNGKRKDYAFGVNYRQNKQIISNIDCVTEYSETVQMSDTTKTLYLTSNCPNPISEVTVTLPNLPQNDVQIQIIVAAEFNSLGFQVVGGSSQTIQTTPSFWAAPAKWSVWDCRFFSNSESSQSGSWVITKIR